MRSRRSLSEVKRRGAWRTPEARLLLVCEGEKTEVIYFSLFLEALRAANVRLEIAERICGSDPLSIVRYAKSLMESDAGIDKCYCIVDRDDHTTFDSAVAEATQYDKRLRADRTFQIIRSYPCFEFWFVLHFAYTRAPFAASRNKSAANCVLRALKKHLPAYEKNGVAIIKSLLDKTEIAICNAERAYRESVVSADPNPSTEVHLLIKELKNYGI